jgi:hypothetical protein
VYVVRLLHVYNVKAVFHNMSIIPERMMQGKTVCGHHRQTDDGCWNEIEVPYFPLDTSSKKVVHQHDEQETLSGFSYTPAH